MKKELMNQEALSAIIAESKTQHPEVEILPPHTLPADDTAKRLIALLQTVYVSHGISNRVEKITRDIQDGNLRTWFAKKDGKLVATASLVHQPSGDVELGRAVSLEKGNGKLLMLLAALAHLEHNPQAPLVAEVRVAQEFGKIPSGEATQHICFELLGLVPHAIAPFFEHGWPQRHESFVLARNDRRPGKTVSELALALLSNRNTQGPLPRVRAIQQDPFQIVVPNSNGQELPEFWKSHDLQFQSGFTLFPVEVTDSNMPLAGMLLANPRVVLCGVDHRPGESGHPIVLFGSVGQDTKIAPSQITDALAPAIRRDLQNIADSFTRLGDQNLRTIGHGPEGFWIDNDGIIWGNWS